MQSEVYILLYTNLKYPAKSVNLEGGNKDKREKFKGFGRLKERREKIRM